MNWITAYQNLAAEEQPAKVQTVLSSNPELSSLLVEFMINAAECSTSY